MDSDKAAAIAANIERARNDISEALEQTGSSRNVLLMAVSKTVGLEEVGAAIEAGVHDFGENRTSELKRKHGAYPNENWHFIGRIQTNKLKDVVGRACLIHSVSSIHAADAIDRIAAKLDIVQPILLEANLSGEESKDGFPEGELAAAVKHCTGLAHVEVRGLMTMAPLGQLDTARQVFGRLREIEAELRVTYGENGNVALNELSMGMTQDYVDAVREGSTIVRLGRSIFA